jgi:hypothetical protein
MTAYNAGYAIGGIPRYWYSMTGAPPGLAINGESGIISGSPSTLNSTGGTITITVRDSSVPFSMDIGQLAWLGVYPPLALNGNTYAIPAKAAN